MHARVRLALLALLVLGCGAIAPSQASAFMSFYDCVNKPGNQWCDGRANGSYDGENSWDYNEAWNNTGGGLFEVCQRVYKPSTGVYLVGASCGDNSTGNLYGDVQCVCYDAEIRHTDTTPRSIAGFADSAW
jgi:hypothetical protein